MRFRSGGEDYNFDLPVVLDSGCSLSVSQTEDSVTASVFMVFDSIPEAWAVFSCRGRVVRSVELDSSSTGNLISIPSDILPTGVNMFSIVTSDGMILSERMFFVHSDDVRRADVEVSESSASPLAPCSVSFKLTDGNLPLRDVRFSVSVTDGSQTDESFYSGGNVLTELLLQSDLRGFIENPGYYFRNRNPKTLKALDELILVHGWRRYDISSRPDTGVQPETAMLVSGRVYHIRKDYKDFLDSPAEVYASIRLDEPGHDGFMKYEGTMYTDSLDLFNFTYTPFYGEGLLTLRATKAKSERKKKKRKPSLKLHDSNFFIKYDDFSPRHVRGYSWYETNKPEILPFRGITEEDLAEGIYASDILPEVDVREKKTNHVDRMMDKPVVSFDFQDVANAVYDNDLYKRYEKMDFHNMFFRNYWSFITRYVLADNMDYMNVDICLDGRRLSYDELRDPYEDTETEDGAYRVSMPGLHVKLNNMASIDKINIVTDFSRRPTKGLMDYFTSVGYVGAYMDVIRFPEGRKRHIVIGREIKLRGFNRPVEYYNPDYSKKQPEAPDYRKTLYWNADVVTDDEGKVEVSFFNNSICKDFKVSIEAVTPDGMFISY